MSIRDLTKELSEQLFVQKKVQEELALVQEGINDIRAKLTSGMISEGHKAHESSGLTVSIRTKKYPQVVDDKALRAHLVSLEKEQDYIVSRFDQVKARNDGAKNGWPGVEVEERQELVVKVAAR